MDTLPLFDAPPAKPRAYLLTCNNADLARDNIFTWTLPAWWVTLSDGTRFNVCPEAGVCGRMCFAYDSTSSYKRFPGARAAHLLNLELTLHHLSDWEGWMVAELRRPRYAVDARARIHDSGDFYSLPYTRAWFRIMKSAPHVRFYAYTKAVTTLRTVIAEMGAPANFDHRFSLGGTEDDLIDIEKDRNADVFPDAASLAAAGYVDQGASDLIAAGPDIKVGMLANRLSRTRKRQGKQSFSQHQKTHDARRSERERQAAVRRAARRTAAVPEGLSRTPNSG
ncbi:hypothetical protein LN042_23045 [Kitasatospora sp. RB6PN24]|uniref:GP88 family protein n=1 Tax=Kitasatospora humi TaxID=2893891 RepID=UPI001E3C9FC3|nr:hypothetical protein [Kitasatospora humi]MCC9309913.1 hypothetical protein [Kitasatospora humi]